jgi:Zn-dependent protease
MGRSLRIGTAFGIGLYVHWTFLIIPFIAVASGAGGGLTEMAVSGGLMFGLFGCVLLHELGHALMARRFGIGTRDITLFPIGGVARLERMSDHPGEEILIAVAGPLVNVVIAAGLWLGLSLSGLDPLYMAQYLSHASAIDRLLILILSANIVLVLFNMIPAFPMDGGRVFRALLSIGFGRLRGTEIAVSVSKVLAALFVVVGLASLVGVQVTPFSSPFLAVIGVFIVAAGNQELAMLRYQERRQHCTAIPIEQSFHPAPPAQPNFSGFVWDPRAGAWIEWRDGHIVGATYVNGTGPQH